MSEVTESVQQQQSDADHAMTILKERKWSLVFVRGRYYIHGLGVPIWYFEDPTTAVLKAHQIVSRREGK